MPGNLIDIEVILLYCVNLYLAFLTIQSDFYETINDAYFAGPVDRVFFACSFYSVGSKAYVIFS